MDLNYNFMTINDYKKIIRSFYNSSELNFSHFKRIFFSIKELNEGYDPIFRRTLDPNTSALYVNFFALNPKDPSKELGKFAVAYSSELSKNRKLENPDKDISDIVDLVFPQIKWELPLLQVESGTRLTREEIISESKKESYKAHVIDMIHLYSKS